MKGADTKPGGGGAIPGIIGWDQRLTPVIASKTVISHLSVVVRNVDKTLFTFFIRVMGNGWWSRRCHVSRLLRWLVRQRREHVGVSFATVRPHRG